MRLTKELDNMRNQFTQDLDKLIRRHVQELEKETKASLNDDKKFQKHFNQSQDIEIKAFLQQNKKDFKSKKEQLKDVRIVHIYLSFKFDLCYFHVEFVCSVIITSIVL